MEGHKRLSVVCSFTSSTEKRSSNKFTKLLFFTKSFNSSGVPFERIASLYFFLLIVLKLSLLPGMETKLGKGQKFLFHIFIYIENFHGFFKTILCDF